MLLHKVLRQVVETVQPIVKKIEARVKMWTKPATDSLIGGTAADLVKSKEQLIVENALLRQQVIVLKRQVARPHQGIHQQIPNPSGVVCLPEHERREVVSLPVLGDLHHDYRWAA